MITITTRLKEFTRCNVRKAQKASARFLRALHYRGIRYIAVMGHQGTIHYHIACKGPKTSKKWVKQKWHRISGCYEVAVTEANEFTAKYLVDKNAALLPNHKEGETAWEGYSGNVFQRVRTTGGLFKKPKQKKKERGRFERFCLSEEVIEAMKRYAHDIDTPPQ